MKNIFWLTALLLIGLGIFVTYEFFTLISIEFTYGDPAKSIEMDTTGQVGDFIGGIVGTIIALAGTILLLLTLNQQSASNYLASFESKLFKLIELHKANVDEVLLHRATKKNPDERIEGRRAFKHVFDDIISCRNDIKEFFDGAGVEQIYSDKYRLAIEQHFKAINRQIDLKDIALLNISYCIVFYGVAEEGEQILENLFKDKFKEDFIRPVVKLAKMKPAMNSSYWSKWEGIMQIKIFSNRLATIEEISKRRKSGLDLKSFDIGNLFYSNDYVKYYGGNQFWLGHYYRHLFQSIKYVNTQHRLSRGEKYFYVKTFRAQLSTYEQALLLVNSLSLLGMIWELIPEYDKVKLPFFGEINLPIVDNWRRRKNLLITKYNLIKNLPGEQMAGIKYRQFYPDIEYEIDRLMKV